MAWKYCPGRGQKIAEEVCTQMQAKGKCNVTASGCLFVGKKRRISEMERTRRSEAMRALNAKRAGAGAEKEVRYEVGDTDTRPECTD